MSYQFLNLEAVAEYLHFTPEDVERRVKDGAIPFVKRGGRIVFNKRDIDAWASRSILELPGRRLAAYHERSTSQTGKILTQEALLPGLLASGAVAPAMTSKTRASVLRDLVALAEKTGHVNDAKWLLESVVAREELCSTAGPGGFAAPHPRAHEPFQFQTSFLIVGRPIQEIHFGAPGGEPTRLFFLLCCQDDRLHLHTLARLCLIAFKTKILGRLLEAPDAQAMRHALVATEEDVLRDRKPGQG